MSSEPESAYFFPSVNVFIVPSVKLTVTFYQIDIDGRAVCIGLLYLLRSVSI